MIKLYRQSSSPQADAIEAEFRDLVLGFDRAVVEDDFALRQFNAPLPVITDNGRVVSGQEAIAAYIKEMTEFVRDWQLFQGDYCYVDSEGNC